MRNDLVKINKVITEHTNQLAPYQFLTAFSQLISRICHSHDEVFVVLMEIIAKVLLAYPQQAMWMMTAVWIELFRNLRKVRSRALFLM